MKSNTLQYGAGAVLAVLATGMLLTLGGCGDDGSPSGAPGLYRITAFLLEDLRSASVRVTRLDSRDRSPRECRVILDRSEMALDPSSTDENATFELSLAPVLGVSHIYRATLGGKTAVGSLPTPTQACSLFITDPPPDSLTFSPGVPVELGWQYGGQAPGEMYLFAVNFSSGIRLLFPFSSTLGPEARSAAVPGSTTSHWASSNQAEATVRARVRTAVTGDLAAEGSTSTVHFAEASIILQRQQLP